VQVCGRRGCSQICKAQIIQWVDHVERMDETAMPRRVLKEKLCKEKDRKTQIKMDG
jgi:hypothetical protein